MQITIQNKYHTNNNITLLRLVKVIDQCLDIKLQMAGHLDQHLHNDNLFIYVMHISHIYISY